MRTGEGTATALDRRGATADRTAVMSRTHLHGLGHLGSGGSPRCECGPQAVSDAGADSGGWVGSASGWVPLCAQHTGWRRAHFVYSDRMQRPSR